MIKTVILDHEPSHRKRLKNLVEEYCPEISLIGELSSGKTALKKLPDLQFELLLLDTELGDMNAFELLSQLPERDFLIIFISGIDKYAGKAFSLNAVDYLMKPIEGKFYVLP